MAGGARGGVGGAWRQDAKRWLNRGGAGRSRGVLAEPVALQPPETAQRRHSQRQGVRKHPAPEGALRRNCEHVESTLRTRQKAPSTRRCIKTSIARSLVVHIDGVRKPPAPEGALRPLSTHWTPLMTPGQKAPSTRRCIKTSRSSLQVHEIPLSESTQHQKMH